MPHRETVKSAKVVCWIAFPRAPNPHPKKFQVIDMCPCFYEPQGQKPYFQVRRVVIFALLFACCELEQNLFSPVAIAGSTIQIHYSGANAFYQPAGAPGTLQRRKNTWMHDRRNSTSQGGLERPSTCTNCTSKLQSNAFGCNKMLWGARHHDLGPFFFLVTQTPSPTFPPSLPP